MVICGSYMFEFSVSKDMKEKDIIRKVTVGKVAAHLCLTLIVKELRIIVEQGRVVTTLNILFSVVYKMIRLGEPIKLSLITCDVSTAYLLHSSSDQKTIFLWEKVRADLTGFVMISAFALGHKKNARWTKPIHFKPL
jgi:hypothetical protein